MSNTRQVVLTGVVALVFMSGLVLGADTYTETDDVGQLPGTAADLTGLAVDRILGTMELGGADMFKIYIADPAAFSASTLNPGTSFDTRLQLFDGFGMGVYANDDGPTAWGTRSLLPAGHALSPTAAGTYFLAVSHWINEPSSVGGDIFAASTSAAVMGPTGPGGDSPITGWVGGGWGGTYEITLTGAGIAPTTAIVPVPGAALLVCVGVGVSRSMLRRVRRMA